eukprot:748182-Alexandrium_andersonii.AAC.1
MSHRECLPGAHASRRMGGTPALQRHCRTPPLNSTSSGTPARCAGEQTSRTASTPTAALGNC